MLYWNNLRDDIIYVIDLVQLPTGVRMIRFRTTDTPPHSGTALSTKPFPGQVMKKLGRERRLSRNVEISDGRLFILDPHDSWLTEDEYIYWKNNTTQAGLDDPHAPWVNHLPPRLPPS